MALGARSTNWTQITAAQLWREWIRLFEGDADLALSKAFELADRLARAHSEKKQVELRRVKRALLDDAFSETETECSDPMGPGESAWLPLPFKGLLKMLKNVGVQRARFRPWERDRDRSVAPAGIDGPKAKGEASKAKGEILEDAFPAAPSARSEHDR